jgi:hypothetical protein
VTDGLKAGRKGMQQEAANELVSSDLPVFGVLFVQRSGGNFIL